MHSDGVQIRISEFLDPQAKPRGGLGARSKAKVRAWNKALEHERGVQIFFDKTSRLMSVNIQSINFQTVIYSEASV